MGTDVKTPAPTHRKQCRRCPATGTELVTWRGEVLCDACFARAMEIDKHLQETK